MVTLNFRLKVKWHSNRISISVIVYNFHAQNIVILCRALVFLFLICNECKHEMKNRSPQSDDGNDRESEKQDDKDSKEDFLHRVSIVFLFFHGNKHTL